MSVDQGETERRRVLAYGGSDNTRPSFNRPQYTVHATKGKPKDLGSYSRADITVKGEIGAESGSQTLFFQFHVTEQERILEIRGVQVNRYTDQYISFSLRDSSGRALVLEPLALDVIEDAAFLPPAISLGYTFCGYWETGYADFDCELTPVPWLFNEAVPDGPKSYYSRGEAILQNGTYGLIVSSSQWARLPYELRIIIDPLPVELSGNASVRCQATGTLQLQEFINVNSITYSQSSVFPGITTASNANMTDNIKIRFDDPTQYSGTATGANGTLEYVQMDLGAVYSVGTIVYATNSWDTTPMGGAIPGDWSHLEVAEYALEYSVDGVSWTFDRNVPALFFQYPGWSNDSPVDNGWYYYSTNISARYIRLSKTGSGNNVLVCEFYALAPGQSYP